MANTHLGSDYVIVFHDAPGATSAPVQARPANSARPWLIFGAFLIAAGGAAAVAAYPWESGRSKRPKRLGPVLDFVYQDGCSACESVEKVLDKVTPWLKERGVQVKPIEGHEIPASWEIDETPALQLRIGNRSVALTNKAAERLANAGDKAVPSLIRWLKRAGIK